MAWHRLRQPRPQLTKTGSRSRPLRVTVVNFTGTHHNWGCQATSQELVALLRRCLPAGSQFRFVPLLPRRRIDLDLERSFGHRITAAIEATTPTSAQRRMLYRVARKRYGARILTSIRDANLVVFQAEGTMTGTEFCAGIRLLLLPYAAKVLWGKPVLSMNQTIYAADESFDPTIRSAYSRFDLVAVREPASLEFARALGLERLVLIPDAAFLTRPDEADRLNASPPGQDHFAVTGSAVLDAPLAERYIRTIAAIQDRFGLRPIFLCSTRGDRLLLEAASRVWSHGNFDVADSRADYRAVAGLMGRCRLLVGGRYHMSLMAAVAGTPFVPLVSNTFKTEGLVALLRYPLEVRRFEDDAAILSDVERVVRERDAFAASIREAVSSVRDMITQGEVFLHRSIEAILEAGEEDGTRGPIVTPQPAILSAEADWGVELDPERSSYYRQVNRLQASSFRYPREKGLLKRVSGKAASAFKHHVSRPTP